MGTFENEIDKLLRGIREEVRQKRGKGVDPNVGVPRDEAAHPLDNSVIDEALIRADKVQAIGENVPPMTEQSGVRRLLAMFLARNFLRVAQIITRDQRQFNYFILVVLRAMRDRICSLRYEAEAVGKQVATQVDGLAQRMVEMQNNVASQVEALEQRLMKVDESVANRVERLERMNVHMQSSMYEFDDVTKPGHMIVGDNQDRGAPRTKISYAQNREDILLARLFSDQKTGFYIDIGAHDPVNYSVTKYFYDLGWHGINVEPCSDIFRHLCAARARDINLNFGLSDREGKLTFYEAKKGAGLSTFAKLEKERHCNAGFEFVERQCEVTTLARICEQYVRGEIDFLSIDVEGHEREVIEGGDWGKWRPRILVIEATKPGTTIPSHERWESLILKADYLLATFDGLNRYYVRAEDSHLLPALRTPVNVFDSYIPYEYLRQIEELKARIAAYERKD